MIQPSGKLGIGHYMGAIRHWVKAQNNNHDCIFSIADLHAITVPQNPIVLREHVLDLVAFYLACGIDPAKSLVFSQSAVPQHAELAWVLSTITSLGELNRMTQFKDKSSNAKRERIGAGLYVYPALMASDILLYQTERVPVGSDQKQHIELARDLAIRFNTQFEEVFTIPEPCISDIGSRIMALGDPYKKMSKSDKDENNSILLDDEPARIKKKIMRSVTDSLGHFQYDPEQQKGLANLINLYAATCDMSIEDVVMRFSGAGYGDFKKDLASKVADLVGEVHEVYQSHRQNEDYLQNILEQGAKQAQLQACETLSKVYVAMGLR